MKHVRFLWRVWLAGLLIVAPMWPLLRRLAATAAAPAQLTEKGALQ
jgi:hypothetical protein